MKSLGAWEHIDFFWEIILKILCLSVKFLALSNDCNKDSPFLTINAIYSSNVYLLGDGSLRTLELKNDEK